MSICSPSMAGWITKLQESNSKLHKEDVLRQALEAATLGSTNAITFLELAKATYNPYVAYGIRKVPDATLSTSEENPWEDFKELLFL